MTSKEALDDLAYIVLDFCEKYGKQDKYVKELIEIIKKDLEVLEILKDKLDIAVYEDEENNIYIMMLRFPKYYHNELIKISRGEHKLLKEWLENEN